MIDPFKNDHQSQQIGQLIIENQTDKVIIYGDIDIAKDKTGLTQALKLKTLFDKIVQELLEMQNNSPDMFKENSQVDLDVNSNKTKEKQSSKVVDNPFL